MKTPNWGKLTKSSIEKITKDYKIKARLLKETDKCRKTPLTGTSVHEPLFYVNLPLNSMSATLSFDPILS